MGAATVTPSQIAVGRGHSVFRPGGLLLVRASLDDQGGTVAEARRVDALDPGGVGGEELSREAMAQSD